MDRRGFLKFVGLGAAAGVGAALLPTLPLPITEAQPLKWAAVVGEEGVAEVFYPGTVRQLTLDNNIARLWAQNLQRAMREAMNYPSLTNRSYAGEMRKRRHIATNFKDWDSRQNAKGSFAKWNQRMIDLKPPTT